MSNQDWVCAICLEDHSTDLCTIRPCGHVFHSQCITRAFEHAIETCPLCRAVPDVIDDLIIGEDMEIPDEPENNEIQFNNYIVIIENNNNIIDNNFDNNIINYNENNLINNLNFYLQDMVQDLVNMNINILSEYVYANINIFVDNEFREIIINEIRNRNNLEDNERNYIINTINNCVNQVIENNLNNNLNNNQNDNQNNNQIVAAY